MNSKVKIAVLNSLLFIQKNLGVVCSEFDLQTIVSINLMKIPEINPNQLHREYPYITIKSENRKRERAHKFDIVVFSKDDVKNINDRNGYLIVHGEDINGDQIKGKKRAVYCTHLFELKLKREHFKDEIFKDFQLLRIGVSYYKKAYPELFSICYFYWNTENNVIYSEIVDNIDELFTEALKDPKINFYLLVGPLHIWFKSISSHKSLTQYINNQTILFLT